MSAQLHRAGREVPTQSRLYQQTSVVDDWGSEATQEWPGSAASSSLRCRTIFRAPPWLLMLDVVDSLLPPRCRAGCVRNARCVGVRFAARVKPSATFRLRLRFFSRLPFQKSRPISFSSGFNFTQSMLAQPSAESSGPKTCSKLRGAWQ